MRHDTIFPILFFPPFFNLQKNFVPHLIEKKNDMPVCHKQTSYVTNSGVGHKE